MRAYKKKCNVNPGNANSPIMDVTEDGYEKVAERFPGWSPGKWERKEEEEEEEETEQPPPGARCEEKDIISSNERYSSLLEEAEEEEEMRRVGKREKRMGMAMEEGRGDEEIEEDKKEGVGVESTGKYLDSFLRNRDIKDAALRCDQEVDKGEMQSKRRPDRREDVEEKTRYEMPYICNDAGRLDFESTTITTTTTTTITTTKKKKTQKKQQQQFSCLFEP